MAHSPRGKRYSVELTCTGEACRSIGVVQTEVRAKGLPAARDAASVTGMRRLVAIIAVALVSAAAPAAASDDESALSVSLAYGTYAIPDYNPHGAVLGVEYERGFSDALAWRISGGAGGYTLDGQRSYSGHLTAGLTYLFDVLKYVPYANLGVGAIVIGGGEVDTQVKALIEIGAGLDVLHSRSLSYGVQLRFESFASQTAFFTAGVRATWRWGFF
jgi:hypothetical protein